MKPKTDPRIDSYIGNAADFAKPILQRIRKLAHQANAEIAETIKWGMPHFEYKGIVCHMAAFKQHCALGFFKASLLPDPYNLLSRDEGMGHFGKITSQEDLPDDEILLEYIRNAVRLNEEGVKVQKKKAPEERSVELPPLLEEALDSNAEAKQIFENLSYSHKKEYIQWITGAKTEATRNRRIASTLEWLAEGKSRNWKFRKK